MCKFEQNISHDVKKQQQNLCKIKTVIYLYILKIYIPKIPKKLHVSTYPILNVRKPCKVTNAKVQIKCLHFCSIYLNNIWSLTCPPV